VRGIQFRSISTLLLTAFVASMTVLLLVDALTTYSQYRKRDEQHRVDELAIYVKERTRTEKESLDSLRGKHAAASEALRRRVSVLRRGWQVDRQFDAWFPKNGDGTRRSRDSLYKGVQTPEGDAIYGIGAYLGHAAKMTEDDKRVLTAATVVLSRVGESDLAKSENFFFLSPNDRLILFAPHRQEALAFFRKTASANLAFDSSYPQPQNNPTGRMRCMPLPALMQDKAEESLISGCISPVFVGGRYVGAWGSTVMGEQYLSQVVRDAPAGARSLIVTEKGEPIAVPGFTRDQALDPDAVARLKQTYGLDSLGATIRAQGKSTGVVESPDGKMLVAYGQLDGPAWLLLVAYPKTKIATGALAEVLADFGGKFLIVAFAAAILFRMVRRLVISPLRALGKSTEGQTEALAQRSDEIGQLARAMQEDRRREDEILEDLETRVQDRTAELERANAAKSDFLASMSHELRTPLNGVIALSDTLAKEQTTERGREMAGLVLASGRMLEQVLNDILDVSRIESGQLTIDGATFELAESVATIAAVHRASAEAKGLTFEVNIDDAARSSCFGDDIRVAQILSNLLSNAVKFTTEGGITLSVARRDELVTLTVTDTGPGISDDTQAQLLSRLRQTEGPVTQRTTGSGLGLAIAGSLAAMMGGQIEVNSEPGKGSTFAVTLPLPVTQAVMEASEVDEFGRVDLSAMKVLVAEDHPTNRTVVSLMLEPFGVRLTLVEDGRQAVEAVMREGFDLILMDLQMPVLDGLGAAREIRSLETARGRPPTPIVALSANALPEHTAGARAAGMDGHLAKPISAEDLLSLLTRINDEKTAEAA
jgi:signal transduction histidine kinase/ActR/RegA family two-component response regulator